MSFFNGDIKSSELTLSSSTASQPILTIENTNNGATSGFIKFINDKGAAGADNDVCGTITFYGDDDNQDNIEFARIEGVVADASNGDECGALKFYVAENDGNNTVGLSITGSTTDGEVDVTIGAGSDSLTTINGDLDIPNGGFALGSDASGDMYYRNSSGVLTRIPVGSDNHVLTLDGAVPGWEAAAGGGGGIAFDGSTANGILTYKDSDEASVESNLTYDETYLKFAANGNIIQLGTTVDTADNVTYSTAQFLSGIILRGSMSTGRTDTTPTAAQIVAAFPSAVVGSCAKLTIVNGETNSGNFSNTVTLSAGTGVSLVSVSSIQAAGATTFIIICTNVTGSSEAVRISPI